MVRVLLADVSEAFERVDHAQLLKHLANKWSCALARIYNYMRKAAGDGKRCLESLVRGYVWCPPRSTGKTAIADNMGQSQAIPLTSIHSGTSIRWIHGLNGEKISATHHNLLLCV